MKKWIYYYSEWEHFSAKGKIDKIEIRHGCNSAVLIFIGKNILNEGPYKIKGIHIIDVEEKGRVELFINLTKYDFCFGWEGEVFEKLIVKALKINIPINTKHVSK